MIPKIIHYMWFGGAPLPEETKQYIQSWKKYCPDYQIKRWDENNFNIHECVYTEEAYNEKKWAFVVDYVRFYALYYEGGVYLETDTELIKPIDILLNQKSFFGRGNESMTLPLIGAEKGSSIAKEMMNLYENQHFVLPEGKLNTKTVNQNLFETLMNKYGLNPRETQNVQILKDGVSVWPRQYFYSTNSETGIITLYPELFVIHHADGSWLSNDQRLYVDLTRKWVKRLGVKFGKMMASLIYHTRKEGIINSLIHGYKKILR